MDGSDAGSGVTHFGITLKRLQAAADNVALSLHHATCLPPADRREASRGYADGYFAGLCYAVGLLVDRSPSTVAAETLGRHATQLA